MSSKQMCQQAVTRDVHQAVSGEPWRQEIADEVEGMCGQPMDGPCRECGTPLEQSFIDYGVPMVVRHGQTGHSMGHRYVPTCREGHGRE